MSRASARAMDGRCDLVGWAPAILMAETVRAFVISTLSSPDPEQLGRSLLKQIGRGGGDPGIAHLATRTDTGSLSSVTTGDLLAELRRRIK